MTGLDAPMITYVAVCRGCGDGTTEIPFSDPGQRIGWAVQHTATTGHVVVTGQREQGLAVMACAPANANQLMEAAGRPERYQPGIDYTQIQCENTACGTDMWIGPRQLAAWRARPDLFLRLCMICAIKATGPDAAVFQLTPTDSPRRA